MHKSITGAVLAILATILLSPLASLANEPNSDETDIRNQIKGWESAWNAGDASAIAAFYDEDADRTFAHGITSSGKTQIHGLYQRAFSADLPDDVEQTLSLEILTVRFITADVAVVDYAYHATGIPIAPYLVVDGRSTVVMVRRDGTWLRSAQRNWIPTTPDCMKLCQEQVPGYPPRGNK